jgi:hypothetical protein
MVTVSMGRRRRRWGGLPLESLGTRSAEVQEELVAYCAATLLLLAAWAIRPSYKLRTVPMGSTTVPRTWRSIQETGSALHHPYPRPFRFVYPIPIPFSFVVYSYIIILAWWTTIKILVSEILHLPICIYS